MLSFNKSNAASIAKDAVALGKEAFIDGIVSRHGGAVPSTAGYLNHEHGLDISETVRDTFERKPSGGPSTTPRRSWTSPARNAPPPRRSGDIAVSLRFNNGVKCGMISPCENL